MRVIRPAVFCVDAYKWMLTPNGGVRAEFTVYEWQPGRFYLVSAGAYEAHDHDYLRIKSSYSS